MSSQTVYAIIEFVSVFLMIPPTIACLLPTARHFREANLLLSMLLCSIFMNLLDAVAHLVTNNPMLFFILKMFVFFLFFAIMVLFSFYLMLCIRPYAKSNQQTSWIILGISAISSLCCIIALFYQMFVIDPTLRRTPDPFISILNIVSIAPVFINLIILFVHRKEMDRRAIISFLIYLLFPLSGFFLRPLLPFVPTLYLAVNFSLLLIYILVQVGVIEEKERESREMQASLTLAQIRPHFLYNVLNSVYYLCEQDPPLAQKAILNFSYFLRGNLDSMEKMESVPFEKEVQLVKNYLALEKLRFGDALEIKWDLQCTQFRTPALSLQPLVSNAVRHGIIKKPDGCGTLCISTRETQDFFEIHVADDGVGFVPPEDNTYSSEHVGIRTVQTRLSSLCSGSLEIHSAPGDGTECIIKIPKV